MAGKTKPFQMRVDEEFLKDLTDLCRDEPDYPSRAEMLRRLVERAKKKGRKR